MLKSFTVSPITWSPDGRFARHDRRKQWVRSVEQGLHVRRDSSIGRLDAAHVRYSDCTCQHLASIDCASERQVLSTHTYKIRIQYVSNTYPIRMTSESASKETRAA